MLRRDLKAARHLASRFERCLFFKMMIGMKGEEMCDHAVVALQAAQITHNCNWGGCRMAAIRI